MQLVIVSGGQTGADRAALDVAIQRDLPYSGWCPRGGRAEDSQTPPGLLARYMLRETPSVAAEQRTAWNVRDSNATLILLHSSLDSSTGTLFTKLCAELIFLRPCHLAAPFPGSSLDSTALWLNHLLEVFTLEPFTLNVAGPRESESPGIYRLAYDFLNTLLDRISPGAEGQPQKT